MTRLRNAAALRVPALAALLVLGAHAARADRLYLQPEAKSAASPLQVGLRKPFDLFLVAERDSGHTQISAVAYTLELPDGVLVVGEELLVDSLLGLGSSRAGLNLVFRCAEGPRLRVLRFRFVATRALEKAEIRLKPDTRTDFLGVVSCKDENFDKFACEPTSLTLNAR